MGREVNCILHEKEMELHAVPSVVAAVRDERVKRLGKTTEIRRMSIMSEYLMFCKSKRPLLPESISNWKQDSRADGSAFDFVMPASHTKFSLTTMSVLPQRK
jgi:hypothetical protein